jgi:hypothetical protein
MDPHLQHSMGSISYVKTTITNQILRTAVFRRPHRNLLRQLVAGLPPRRPRFGPRLDHRGYVVDEVVLGHVSSEYFSFSCQLSNCSILMYHLGLIKWPTRGGRTKYALFHPSQRIEWKLTAHLCQIGQFLLVGTSSIQVYWGFHISIRVPCHHSCKASIIIIIIIRC